MTLRKILAIAGLTLALSTSGALANYDDDGGSNDTRGARTSYNAISAETSSSAGGLIVPIILLVIVAAVAAN